MGDKITLQNVTIRWEDLNEVANENIQPLSVEIIGPKGYTIKNNVNNIEATSSIFVVETNSFCL